MPLRTQLALPSEDEFFQAISDYGDVLVVAAGRHLSLPSSLLEAQSSVFRDRLARFRAGNRQELTEQDGKIVVDLDCSYSAAQLLFKFITSRGDQFMNTSVSPVTLRELACVAKEWQVHSLLASIDTVLAMQMRADMERFVSSDVKTWQYSGGHIRERAVKMLQLSLEVGLVCVQDEAVRFIAANWSYLATDVRITRDLDAETSRCLQQMVQSMHSAPPQFKASHPAGRCKVKGSKHAGAKFRQKAAR